MEIRSDLVDELSRAELKAWEARLEWMRLAEAPDRAGKQLLPPGDDWSILIWRAGRGFGKTIALSQAMFWEMWRFPNMIGHSLAATLSDVAETNFKGPAGLKAVVPPECLRGGSWDKAYVSKPDRLYLANGSLVRGFATTEEGNRLRGPQCHFLTGDEAAAWDRPKGNFKTAFENAMFGVRLPYPDGSPARAVLGTTPKPIPFMRNLEKRYDVRVIRGSSYENIRNLNATYKRTLESLEGTSIGRQEIHGDYIDDEEIGIFSRAWFPLWPAHKPLPDLIFILEVYDTAFTDGQWDAKNQKRDPTASIVLGVFSTWEAFTEDERKKMGVRSRFAAVMMDAWDEHLGFPELLDRARLQHRKKWGPQGRARKADVVLIEEKGSGISLRQTLMKYGVPTWPYNPGREGKTLRAHAASPIVKQRMIFIPESARPERKGMVRDWAEPFMEEVCAYAGEGSTEHDDYLDCMTSALAYLGSRGFLEAQPDERFLDPEDKLEHDQKEAQRIYGVEKRQKRGNPYAA